MRVRILSECIICNLIIYQPSLYSDKYTLYLKNFDSTISKTDLSFPDCQTSLALAGHLINFDYFLAVICLVVRLSCFFDDTQGMD